MSWCGQSFFIIVILGAKYFIEVVVCIFLMTTNVENLFMCVSPYGYLFSENIYLNFCPFLIGCLSHSILGGFFFFNKYWRFFFFLISITYKAFIRCRIFKTFLPICDLSFK